IVPLLIVVIQTRRPANPHRAYGPILASQSGLARSGLRGRQCSNPFPAGSLTGPLALSKNLRPPACDPYHTMRQPPKQPDRRRGLSMRRASFPLSPPRKRGSRGGGVEVPLAPPFAGGRI